MSLFNKQDDGLTGDFWEPLKESEVADAGGLTRGEWNYTGGVCNYTFNFFEQNGHIARAWRSFASYTFESNVYFDSDRLQITHADDMYISTINLSPQGLTIAATREYVFDNTTYNVTGFKIDGVSLNGGFLRFVGDAGETICDSLKASDITPITDELYLPKSGGFSSPSPNPMPFSYQYQLLGSGDWAECSYTDLNNNTYRTNITYNAISFEIRSSKNNEEGGSLTVSNDGVSFTAKSALVNINNDNAEITFSSGKASAEIEIDVVQNINISADKFINCTLLIKASRNGDLNINFPTNGNTNFQNPFQLTNGKLYRLEYIQTDNYSSAIMTELTF